MDSAGLLVGLLLFVFGVSFGSFANVVIWRLPRGESLSSPPSHCPGCDAPIKWYDNVPLLSWVLLGGRCRSCQTRISPRYPFVELASGILWVVAWVQFGEPVRTGFAIAFYYLLLILAAIDIDTYRLPNLLVALLGMIGVAGIVLSVFMSGDPLPLLTVDGVLAAPLAASVVGALAGSGFALAIALAYERTRKKQGFGMGDVKLLAVMGPFLGAYSPLVLFFASVIGAVVGLAVSRVSDEGLSVRIPFGPFLALGALVTTVFGPAAWEWYLGLLI